MNVSRTSPFYQFVSKSFQILVIALVLTTALIPVGSVFADAGSYPLTGELGDPSAPAYNVVWEPNGRLWQPMLPEKALRREFTVSFRISEGTYVFNGSEAELHLDETRNGNGLDNPKTVGYGNDLEFTVKTRDGEPAWAIVYGRGNASGGFDIWATSPTYSGAAYDQPDQSYNEQPYDQPRQSHDYTFVIPSWISWIFTGTGVLLILSTIFFLLASLATLGLWIWSTVVMWNIDWLWGVAALVTGFFFPIIGPIIWLILSGMISRSPIAQPLPSR